MLLAAADADAPLYVKQTILVVSPQCSVARCSSKDNMGLHQLSFQEDATIKHIHIINLCLHLEQNSIFSFNNLQPELQTRHDSVSSTLSPFAAAAATGLSQLITANFFFSSLLFRVINFILLSDSSSPTANQGGRMYVDLKH
jgi:hypothetical protein